MSNMHQMEAMNGICLQSTEEEKSMIRKGAWSFEEDCILINYIATHGEGRWNYLARNSGLKRTGRSSRMRWKNYLRPNVRRGNFTPEEQLRIIKLHCSYGNRWSKIAQCLPGRTDNEIKNYWRTRVQKQAKLVKCDINSLEFREFIVKIWLPKLSQQIEDSKYTSHTAAAAADNDHFDDMMLVNSAEGLAETCSNGPADEPHQIDYWADDSVFSEPLDAHPVSVMDNYLSKSTTTADCWFRSFTSGLDLGQDCFHSPYGFQLGIDSTDHPASSWFNSQEFSDMLPPNDYFWLCP